MRAYAKVMFRPLTTTLKHLQRSESMSLVPMREYIEYINAYIDSLCIIFITIHIIHKNNNNGLHNNVRDIQTQYGLLIRAPVNIRSQIKTESNDVIVANCLTQKATP